MNKSDSIQKVMTALGDFQAEAIKITKDSTNPHFKSKYASLAAILTEIQPILSKHKLVFTQVPEENTHLITMLFHSASGEYIESRYCLSSSITTPQAIGSAITYARRYSLTALLGLNIDDDDDGNAGSTAQNGNKQPAPPPVPAPAPPQAAAPAATQTPFNKQYTDAGAIIAVIRSAAKIEEINLIYNHNKELVEKGTEVKTEISKRRDTINNNGKVIITDKQYATICNRIRNGEKLIDRAKGNYILNTGQIEELEHLTTQRALFDDALKVKYNNPADISGLIRECPTWEDLKNLHANNAMIIDRDAELLKELNGRTKTFQAA